LKSKVDSSLKVDLLIEFQLKKHKKEEGENKLNFKGVKNYPKKEG